MKHAYAVALLATLASCSAAESTDARNESALRANALTLDTKTAAQSADWVGHAISMSERIVVGRVVDVHGAPQGPAGEAGVHTRIAIAVERSLLGSKTEFVEFWVEGGRTETRARIVSLQARFSLGEEVLVFLVERQGALRLTQMGLSKWTRVAGLPESFIADIHAAQYSTVATRIELRAEDIAEKIALRRLR